MRTIKNVRLEYGDGTVDAEVPDSAVIIRAGAAHDEPAPLPDPVAATRDAIRNPLGSEPLTELVGPGSQVTIAIPDRVKGGTHPTAHRRVTTALLLDELERAGVRRRDARLVCAIGLHRKNRTGEFAAFLGAETLASLGPGQVVNHDAEDPDGIVDLGRSPLGDVVQVNRAVLESDLTILLGHTAGNPYGGFSGGYKMPATGLTTWRSIRGHHAPSTMHREDFVPPSPQSHFRDQLRSIGETVEAAMPRPFFAVDAVLDSASRQLAVVAGAITEVERVTWPVAAQRTEVIIDGPPFDVLVIGMPRSFHYGSGMGSNPLLMMQAVGASVSRAKAALRPDPVVIAASVCDGWFNTDEFPASPLVYERLQQVGAAAELVRFEDEISTDPQWTERYRHDWAYHPFHAFSMAYMGGLAHRNTSAMFIAGAEAPEYARGMGALPVPSVEAALVEAREFVGRDPRVLVIQELSKPAYHLAAG